ncbi:MAG: hypothetical protein LJE94_06645 [Deltaproteobacteria bacterium]|nr:hypothetical protein [Deltaproteobacteria bacterium]
MKNKSKGRQLLIESLAAKGLEDEVIPSLIRSMRICYDADPKMPSLKTNRRIRSLGWNNFKLDNHILKISIDYFKKEIRNTSPTTKEINHFNESFRQQ